MLFLLILSLLSLQDVRAVANARQPKPATVAAAAKDRYAALLDSLRQRNIEVEFTGGAVFSSDELLKILAEDKAAADYFADGVGAEKFEDGDDKYERLPLALKLLRNRLTTRGYLQATTGEPKLESNASGRRITIPVTEGTRYRMGEIKFEGALLFSVEELNKKFPIKTGDVASGEAIYHFLYEQLKKEYMDRGYVQYTADAEPTFQPPTDGSSDGVADYLITIDEGKCFILDSVEFTGNASTPDRVLRRALRLREGKPFNQTLLEQSLKNLDALNLFYLLDLDRDVDFEQYEESSRIKIRIKLTEKHQP
jgi:outer membrane protein insertion porin family